MQMQPHGSLIEENVISRLNNVKKTDNPSSVIVGILDEIKKMKKPNKERALVMIHDHVTTQIESITELSMLQDFHFGCITKSSKEPWVIHASNSDTAIRQNGQRLDQLYKKQVICLLNSEIQKIAEQDPLVDVNGAKLDFEKSRDEILKFYSRKVKRTSSYDEVWDITQMLIAIQQASLTFLKSPAFTKEYNYLCSEAGGLKYVHIFNTGLANTIFKKLEDLHAIEFANCENDRVEAIRLFYKYPVIKHHIKAMSEKFDQIMSIQ